MNANTSNPAGSPTIQDTTTQPAKANKPAEFQAFENLTQKLAKVPKKELDEKRREPG